MISLKEASRRGKLAEFLAEHEGGIGDREDFEATLRSMAGKSKEDRPASRQDEGDD